MTSVQIRETTVQDAGLILEFIRELAIYEKAEHKVKATIKDIEHSLFGPDATAKGLICQVGDTSIGYAVYFHNYSTWLGKNGLYLEDLYVTPSHRGTGAGKAMLKHLAKMAVEKGCGRFEWSVLDWNEPAIEFYKSIGALPQREWIIYRLDGDRLRNFAGK